MAKCNQHERILSGGSRDAGFAGDGGFSLPEVLVILAVLAVALLASAQLFLAASREQAASCDLTSTTVLASDRIEELRTADYSNLAAGATTEHVKLKRLAFQRTTTITDNVPHPGMKLITVEVRPLRDVSIGASGTVVLSVYRADPSRDAPGSSAPPTLARTAPGSVSSF